MSLETILAIDPGNQKCGLAIADNEKAILRKIVETGSLLEEIKKIIETYKIEKLILGDGTFSKKVKPDISDIAQSHDVELVLIDEKFSTEEARKLYFAENKPKGIWRLVPLGLQSPSEPIDDYAALVLAKRYFENK